MSIQLNQLLERTLARAAFLLKKLKSEFEEEGDRKDGWCVCGGGDNENLQTSAVALKVIPGAVVVVCVAAVS